MSLSTTPSPHPVGTLLRDRLLGDTYRVTEPYLTENGNYVAVIESIFWEEGEEESTGAFTAMLGYGVGAVAYPNPVNVEAVEEAA